MSLFACLTLAISPSFVAADHTQQMAQQMALQGGGGGAMGGPGKQPPNMNQLFKDEWEALQVVQHTDSLEKMESELLLMRDHLPDLPRTNPQLKKRN